MTEPPGHPTPSAANDRWLVETDEGPAGDFHRRDPGPDPGHRLWVRRLPRPALVLGSTQPDGLVVAERAEADGIEVCRRRSGGGLVYLDPRTDCWIDAIVPAGSPLWDDDIGRAFHWLGQRWADVLDQALDQANDQQTDQVLDRAAGPPPTPGPWPALVHRQRPGVRRAGRPLWCFAELGNGEVSIGGSKVVGLSQRRTRGWLRLQSLVLGAWPGRRLLGYLDPDLVPADGPGTDVDPGAVAAGPPPGVRLPPPGELTSRFLDGLPDPARLATNRR